MNTSLSEVLVMHTVDGRFYPIMASGAKPIKDEAQDHGELNAHIQYIEDAEGNVLWRRQ